VIVLAGESQRLLLVALTELLGDALGIQRLGTTVAKLEYRIKITLTAAAVICSSKSS